MRRVALLCAALVLGARAAIAAEPPPLIILLIDTVRADSLRTFNPATPIGEQIDRLARDGVVFEQARASSSWTRTSVATLLTGLPERVHKVYERGDVLSDQIDTLAERLKAKGYRATGWSANPNVLRVWGFGQGFDSFLDVGATTWPKHKAHAGELLARALPTMRAAPAGPSLYYIHFMDAHGPYQPDDPDLEAVRANPHLATLFPGDETAAGADKVRKDHQRYLAEIAGLDREIGVLLDELRAAGLYDRAAILLVADHGEEFLDHGGTEHGKTLYEEMIHVPAILKLPRQAAAGTRVTAPVTMADFAPTLLRLAGVEAADLPGTALWDGAQVVTPPSRPSFATLRLDEFDKRAVVDDGWKLIEERDESTELFQLADDPKEKSARRDEERGAPLRGAIAAADAQQQEGWHLRYCGPSVGSSVSFRMSTTGNVRASLLEPSDSVAPTSNAAVYLVKLSLNKAKGGDGEGAGEKVVDEDEIWIGSSAAPASADLRGRIRFSLGKSAEVQTQDSLRLDESTKEVEVRGGVSCSQAVDDASHAYLRVWRVPAVEKVPEAEVDPAVRERMRALGYGN